MMSALYQAGTALAGLVILHLCSLLFPDVRPAPLALFCPLVYLRTSPPAFPLCPRAVALGALTSVLCGPTELTE